MRNRQVLVPFFVAAIITVGFLLGQFISTQRYSDSHDAYYGIWQGTGLIDYQGAKVKSHLVLILREKNSRISVNNYLEGENFAMDADITIRENHQKHVYFDLSNRKTNGLESFIDRTNIDVPHFPLLFHIEAFHLEDDAIFLNMNNPNRTLASYKLTKKQ
ncbi:hypothetical protein [Vibrio agarivorans]|uniref:DUF2850 domain-containing protein n=1 Tax=Vibrio agarivorans TaxID=153622 RepID=A0ABT7XWR2_9VIBR|nr:hypothetical protein [Vibrio agarivorans]MDN2480212.1 hypothetical protein [Vibrio agarivorans]